MFKTTLCKATASDVFPAAYEEGRFVHIDTLGRGAFSAVFRASDSRAGREVAVKAVQMPKDEQSQLALAHEIEVLEQLDHPGIVQLYESIHGCLEGVIHLVMELLPGSTMRTLLDQRGALPEADVVPIVRQLFSALDYLHTRAGFVHRDLKPENIMPSAPLPASAAEPLLASMLWKLCDFGVSVRVGGAHGASSEGSVETLFFTLTCSRCSAPIAVPPRLKSRGLKEREKVRCPRCGHVFIGEFEPQRASAAHPSHDGAGSGSGHASGPSSGVGPELHVGLGGKRTPPEEAASSSAAASASALPERQASAAPGATIGGTAGYMAPEMEAVDKALRRGGAISADQIACLSAPPLDLYSMGRVIHFALTGVHPNSSFQFESLENLVARTLVRRPSFSKARKGDASSKRLERRKDLSVAAQALLAALTAAEPAERPAAGSPAIREWLAMMESAPELLSAQLLNK